MAATHLPSPGRRKRGVRRTAAAVVAIGAVAALAGCHGRLQQHATPVAALCTTTAMTDGQVISESTYPSSIPVEVEVPTWTSPGDRMPLTGTLELDSQLWFSNLELASDGWLDSDGDQIVRMADAASTASARVTVTASPGDELVVRFVSAEWSRAYNLDGSIGSTTKRCVPTDDDVLATSPVVDVNG